MVETFDSTFGVTLVFPDRESYTSFLGRWGLTGCKIRKLLAIEKVLAESPLYKLMNIMERDVDEY